MVESPPEPMSSLYVHVPFCAQKCSYCAFFSEASSGALIGRYVEALGRELELVASDLKPRTIFFGGGTPSLLTLRQWAQVLETMGRLGLLGAEEFTVECNPATVSLEKARLLRAHGVNRVSMGVQSLDAALLERLGRVHSRAMAFKSFDILRQAGFENLNLDLMFAIPGQTLEIWRRTLAEATAMGSEHLSSYEVIYEEDTALYAQLQAGKFEVNEDLACRMYEALVEQAVRAGYQQYEIANFAKDGGHSPQPIVHSPQSKVHSPKSKVQSPKSKVQSPEFKVEGAELPGLRAGVRCPPFRVSESGETDAEHPKGWTPNAEVPLYACRHNVNYWRGGGFYGLGPSATSYVRGVRTKNWSNTQLYCEQLERGQRAIESREELSPLARAGETAAFGLRMIAGWPFEEFRRTTGHELRRDWAADMSRLEHQGWGRMAPDRFQLTTEGLRFADVAAQMFLR